MAGRHSAGGYIRWGRVIGVAAAVLLVAGGATYVAVRGSGDSKHNAAKSGHGTSSSRVPSGSCQPIAVVADPQIAPAVTKFATTWNRTRPRTADGRCVTAAVTSAAGPAAVTTLSQRVTPSVWIPDSPVWPIELVARAPALATQVTTGPPVASTPIVLATAPAHAPAMTTQGANGWAAAMLGPAPVSVPDPIESASGALTISAVAARLGGIAQPDKVVGTYFTLAGTAATTPADALARVTGHPATSMAAATTEQAVARANAAAPAPVVAAVRPSGATPWLTFPFVLVAPSGADAPVHAAQQAFQRALAGPAADADLAAADLRGPDGTPITANPATPTLAAGPSAATSAPSATALNGALRLWSAAVTPSRLLTVWDVSGSMDEDAGDGQSKIRLASAAAQKAIAVLPSTWHVGVWTFSSKPSPQRSWTPLVGLNEPVGADRQSLLGAVKQFPKLVGGNTALYATTLAAYRAELSGWNPTMVNDVAILTDGENLDPGGPALTALLADLKRLRSTNKPVRIITIAIGAKADVPSLGKISAATGGTTFVVTKPEQIQTAILGAILERA